MISEKVVDILEVLFDRMELIDYIDCYKISEEDLKEFFNQYITRLYEGFDEDTLS